MSHLFLVLWLFGCLFLHGCQLNSTPVQESTSEAQEQRHKAASYNVQLGIAYLKQGNRTRAKKKLLKALQLTPESAEVQEALAYYFEVMGDLQRARFYYQQAVKLDSKTGAILNNYGVFLCRQGEYKAAEKYFLKALADTYYLNTAGAYENAGLCAALIPNEEKASSYFIKALMQDPMRKQKIDALIDALEVKTGNRKLKLVYQTFLKDCTGPRMIERTE